MMSLSSSAAAASVAALFWTLASVPGASGQATSANLKVRALAEVEVHTQLEGRDTVRLIPADRVVPGDEVIYTLEIRNTGSGALASPIVVEAVPDHLRLVADSATGPGVEVTYSVDGGRSFERAENLRVLDASGQSHLAKSWDYTHIQWKFKNTLKSKSVAFARFRAVVK